MKDTKTTSRTALLNLMLLKAWRERWSDAKWGINIKTVLPRGVSGDVYNLADCILQQAVIGSSANLLALSYLKHSLCAHLISHAAVLKRIAKFEDFDKVYCLTALLDLLNSIMDGVTCRGKPEESILPSSMISLILWLMKIILVILKVNDSSKFQTEEQNIFNKIMELMDKIINNDFLLGILYIAKQEETEIAQEIQDISSEINLKLKSTTRSLYQNQAEFRISQLTNIDAENLDMTRLNSKTTETITYCVQPMFTIAILINPTYDTNLYVSQMLMLQRLKGFSNSRLFYEIIRTGLIALSNTDISHDSMWSAMTFIKIPQILKKIYAKKEQNLQNYDHIPDVVEALDMMVNDTFILDYIDAKCEKNFIEFLLKEWATQHIVTEEHVKIFAAQREPISPIVNKYEVGGTQTTSVINLIICAGVPLSGLLKTLTTDYNKPLQLQEPLLEVLCQVLTGNSFDLILQVAAVEDHLKTFVSGLIKCNENSKQVTSETGKQSLVRSTLFDVSFSMLTFIVQIYGSEIVLSADGESFFAKWMCDFMIEKNRMKYPKNMVALCDESIVDEILMTLNKPDGQLKNCNVAWQDICMNIPGVLYQVLVAWENETLSNTDVKRIMERIMRPFSYSICAASYLCSYMQTVKEDEFLKPHNMVHLMITNSNGEDITGQHHEHIKERFGLTNSIIRKMLNDVQPTPIPKNRNSVTRHIVSNSPLEEHFHDVWKGIVNIGWLTIKSGEILESLLRTCGPVWFVNQLIGQILKCKYSKELKKVTDLVFAIMHLDIERTTNALIQSVIPSFLVDKQVEPQSSTLARLCVYSLISNLEVLPKIPFSTSSTTKKRGRDEMEVDGDSTATNSNLAKLRKLNTDITSVESCSKDFSSENLSSCSTTQNSENKDVENVYLQESLQISLQALFKIFNHFVISDELSPRIYFIFQFITLLVECGSNRVQPILKLLPNNLVQNLLKVMVTDEIKVGLICRLYDLRAAQGRAQAVSDLCLLRNIRMKKQSINL